MNTQRIVQEQQTTVERIRKIKVFLNNTPEGHISRNVRAGNRYYYIDSTKDSNRSRKYIGSEIDSIALEYIKKAYYEKLLSKLEQNYKAQEYFLKHYDPNPEQSALELLPDWIMQAIRNDASTDKEKYIQEWLKADYERNPLYADKYKIQTLRGDYVRSKSERDIANSLYRYGLAYRSDCLVKLVDGPVYADLVILHPVTLETYYWEHSGMLDEQSYIRANYDRIARYASSGILIGERLIVTGETRNHVLGSQAIDRIIETYFGQGNAY